MRPGSILPLIALARFCLDQRLYLGAGDGSSNGRSLSSLSSEMYAVLSAVINVSGLLLTITVGFQLGRFWATGGLCAGKTAVADMDITVGATDSASVETLAGVGTLGVDSGCDELPAMIRALRCSMASSSLGGVSLVPWIAAVS